MGTEEAAELWGLTQDHIKKLCRLGKCNAVRIGKTWVVARDQNNPAKERGSKNEEQIRFIEN